MTGLNEIFTFYKLTMLFFMRGNNSFKYAVKIALDYFNHISEDIRRISFIIVYSTIRKKLNEIEKIKNQEVKAKVLKDLLDLRNELSKVLETTDIKETRRNILGRLTEEIKNVVEIDGKFILAKNTICERPISKSLHNLSRKHMVQNKSCL